ncbi:MAG TPA: tetratricopeptide repeat protein [Geobacteraceae bacterium]
MGSEATSYWAEIQQYEEILGNNPASYCFVPLAELYRKKNLLDDALAIVEKGCDRYPGLVSGQLVLGKVLLDRGHTNLARQALDAVVQAIPDCTEALWLLGQLYMDAGEYEAARQAFTIVIELKPDDTECRLLLSSLPSSSGEQEREQICAASAVTSPETSVFVDEADEELEEIELIEELTEEPVEIPVAAEEGPAISSPAPLTTVTMAELYVQQGFIERAMGIYREILVDEPSHMTARQRLAELEASLVAPEEVAESAPLVPSAAAQASSPDDKPVAAGNEVVVTLQQWLTNIGRVREWHSRKV